jgi:PLP dependent protein
VTAGPDPRTEAIRAAAAGVARGIAEACDRADRDPAGVRLVAVTKTVPPQTVGLALEAGLKEFGENYAAELARKAAEIPALWHFLGNVQTGTAARIAESASVIHSAEPGGGLEAVARRAAARGRTIECLAQVDFTGRRQGVDPEDVEPFLQAAASLPGVRFVGLMTLPPLAPDPELSRPYFARLRTIRDRLRDRWPEVVELSMGMSGDFPVAVEEGATMVRVGTALFGERPVLRGNPHDRRPAGGGASAR